MPNIKARITNKHDTEANWALAENFKPLAGEVIVYDVDSNHAYPRFKVGDGKTLVSALPFSTDVLASYVTETELASALNETTSAINKNIATIDDEVATHVAAINNPHQVTKAQVGLNNVDNVKQYSASNPPPYGTLTFTGAVEDSFTASTSKTINIPTIAGPTGPTGPTGANGANIVDITVTPTSAQIGGVSIPLINGITDANKILMVNNDGTSYELELLNNLTVENASNANMAQDSAKLGGIIAANYAQIDGSYSGMTVGAATKATQDGSGNNIVDTYVDKASEQVITGRKVFYGDKAPLNVKYETQETGNTFSYAPVTFYDNADKKLGAVQGQKTGNGTVQTQIDLYDKDGNYAASMGLKWDYSTQKVFPFAPSGQNVVPNGDSSDKIVCSEFLQGTTIFSSVDGIVTNTGYRGKNYNISLGSTKFTTGQGGNIYVERSGNVVNIFGWLRNHSVLNNGTAYVLLSGLPKAISGAMGVAPYASMNGVCRAYINAGGRELYFTPSFLVDATTIAAMSWFSICMTYITNE